MNISYLPSGETSLLLEFKKEISEEVNQKIRKLEIAINKANINGIIEIIPAYCSLKIDYNPLNISQSKLIDKINSLKNNISDLDIEKPEVVEIPTLYRGEDIEYVAKYNNLSVKEVIEIHSSKVYLIYMLGFITGFPYLGGMSEKIATPRLENPRTKIKKGSVGIADSQTGIYPLDTPGGWRIIGKTPLNLFDPKNKNPFLLEAGNYVKFKPIDKKEFNKIKYKMENNSYKVNSYPKDVK